jgi:hypothetical protein
MTHPIHQIIELINLSADMGFVTNKEFTLPLFNFIQQAAIHKMRPSEYSRHASVFESGEAFMASTCFL